MGGPGLNAFVKQFFPQIRKEGMIIDVRYNGGGFVDQLIFERLRRILVGMGAARNFEPTLPPGGLPRLHGLHYQPVRSIGRRYFQRVL